MVGRSFVRWALAAALAVLPSAWNSALAQSSGSGQKAGLFVAGQTLVSAPTPQGSWPAVLPQPGPGSQPPLTWTPAEIDAARAQCNRVLAATDAVALPVEPFRHGAECGAAASVQLISIGANPQVALSPPVIVTCDLVATLESWVRSQMQPIAKRHLGAPVIRIETMSSYACRNAYGRKRSRLSEHGRANAIDIRGFMTAAGLPVAVLDDWGATQRTIEANIAAAKAAAAKAVAANPPPAVAGQPPVGAAQQPAVAVQPTTQQAPSAVVENKPVVPTFGTIVEGASELARRLPGVAPRQSDTGFGFAAPSRLGGPKAPTADGNRGAARGPTPDSRMRFLKEVHASACRVFGTVLGPEANREHENHFHFDMAERKSSTYCE